MAGEFDKVVSLFATFKQEVLTFNFNVNGKDAKTYLLEELLCGGEGDDYETLKKRLKDLGPIHLFYGVLALNAEKTYSAAKEEFDSWYASVESEVNDKMIQEIQALNVAAGLKKAPTGALIKGRIMKDYGKEWSEWQEKLKPLEEKSKLLNLMMTSIGHTIKLSTTESGLMQSAITRGLEEAAPITPSKKLGYTPKPPDEAF